MCRGRSVFRAALLAALILLLPVTAWAEEEPQFRFVLSVEGETEKQAQPGDTVTAALRLKRTDSDDGYAMYAMQDEVVYDPAFLQLLPENIMTADGVRTADVAAAVGFGGSGGGGAAGAFGGERPSDCASAKIFCSCCGSCKTAPIACSNEPSLMRVR